MNESGLDPGIDHMLAMECFDQIREHGGKVPLAFPCQCFFFRSRHLCLSAADYLLPSAPTMLFAINSAGVLRASFSLSSMRPSIARTGKWWRSQQER